MKQILIGLVVLSCFVAVPFAAARDADRDSIQREWVSSNTQPTVAKSLSDGKIYSDGNINVNLRERSASRGAHHMH